MIEAQKKIANVSNDDLLVVVKYKHELANLHLLKAGTNEKPAILANESRATVDRILGQSAD